MKKYLLILILATTAFTFPLKSQNYSITWERGDNFPIRLSEIRTITYDDKIYVIGGKITNDNADMSDNEDVDYTYEYNSKNKKWSKKFNMPFKDYDVTLTKVIDKIFAIGSKTAMYDPLTDKWELRKPLEDGKAHLEAVVLDNKIYIIGFFECSNPHKIMKYDPQTDEWTEMSPIPIARIMPIVTVYNDKIYVFGGIGLKENGRLDFSKQLDNIDVYDPKTDTWESKKPMPDYLLGAKCTKVINNEIFFININSVDNKLKENTYVYNPDTETWRAYNINLPENWYDSEGIALLNNKIYIIGGHDNSFKQYNDVYIGTIKKQTLKMK